MISCPSCGATCEAGARFCLECGESLEGVDAAQPDDPWLGRMIAGRFRLLSKLGDGGMGEVYRAEQMPMGRHIALKILRQSLSDDPKQVERFKREAQAASALSHPNTIIVHDFGQDVDGTLFIAMELLEGDPLNEVLEREGAMSPERAATILRQVCGSLDEAHSQGLVHRDLKPENIFLTERAGANDFVKVLDFGIAKVTESGGQKLDTITQAGAIFGTPQYMAPEQIRGEGVDARADIYALGVILYEMISGHLPFAAGSVVEMLTKHLTAPPAPIARTAEVKVDPNLPRLEAIALRALSKDPTRRQQSARAFLEDLMAAMPQLSLTTSTGLVAAAPAGAAEWTEPASSGNAGKVVLVAAILAALGAGGFFFLGQNGGGVGPVDAAPAVLLQPVGDNGGGGGPASAPASKAPASDAAASQPASAAPASAAAPASDDEPTAEEKAAAAAAEKAAEEQAKKDEEEAKKAEAEANKPMSDEEAARIAAAAEAEAKQADAEAKKAAAEKKAKEQAEKAKKAEAAKAEAQAAKANAEAAKQAAQQQAAEAKAQAEAAKAQAKEAAAKAKAEAAKNEAEKQAALAAQKKAAEEAAAAKAEADKVKAAAAAQAAAAAKLKAEADALKAQLAKIEEEKAAAAAAEAEAKAKKEEAKKKAAAARKKKRAKSATAKIYIRTRSIGGRISVNGKLVGRSPVRVSLKPGKHRITATNRKGRKTSKTITVKPGKVQRIKLGI